MTSRGRQCLEQGEHRRTLPELCGGSAACANKCSPTCSPREEYTKVRTSECGITVPPFEGTTWGEANATCTTPCNGGSRSCSVWHDARGRALCTFGAPVDAAGNFW
ncbi:hypothetical protein BH11MYX4_BH11MYX4_45400 [soil metagenome]